MFLRAGLTYYPVWWSSDKTYKNAITNELFVLTSAEGHIRNGDQKYLDNAQKVSTLFSASSESHLGCCCLGMGLVYVVIYCFMAVLNICSQWKALVYETPPVCGTTV